MAEKPHQTAIRTNTPFLVDNLRAQDITDHLFADGYISIDEQEIIDVTPGDRAKIRKLVKILYAKDEKAFSSFIKALETTGSGYVKEQLLQTLREISFVPRDSDSLDIDPSQILLSPAGSAPSLEPLIRCSEDEPDAEPVKPKQGKFYKELI